MSNAHLKEAYEALAEYLYNSISFSEQFDENVDAETRKNRQEFLDARNRYILWLFRNTDIRGVNAPIVNSCIQQLLSRSDAPLSPNSKMIVVSFNELKQIIMDALNPKSGFWSPPYMYTDYYHTELHWLQDARVKQALQSKFGTDEVEVLEEIICRDQTKLVPKLGDDRKPLQSGETVLEQQNINEAKDNAIAVLTVFFNDLEPIAVHESATYAAAASLRP